MNWKQLAKAVVDEVKKWADERFADVAKVKLLVAAETREANDATVARIAALQGPVDELGRKVRELAGRPAPLATVDGGVVTQAVSAWFEKNPPPVPKDGASVKVEDLEPYLQAGLAKWQLEFERNASGVLQRFLDKLRQPKDGEPGKDASPEGIAAAVTAWFKSNTPLPIPAEALELSLRDAVAAYLKANPPPAGKDAEPPSPAAVGAAVAEYLGAHPPAVTKGDPGPGPTAAAVGDAVARYLEAHPIRVPADGKAVTAEDVRAAVDSFMAEHPLPQLDAAVVTAACLEEVRAAAAAWLRKNPPPGPAAEAIHAAVDAYCKANPPPARGPTPDEVAPLFAKAFAEWALDFERRAAGVFERAIGRIEKPKDGRDGLNVDNFAAELEPGTRNLRLVLADGERRRTATCKLVGLPLDRGVFKDNEPYELGDGVTFGGSFWLAQKDEPKGRPGQTADWRLAVKHGRDAKK